MYADAVGPYLNLHDQYLKSHPADANRSNEIQTLFILPFETALSWKQFFLILK